MLIYPSSTNQIAAFVTTILYDLIIYIHEHAGAVGGLDCVHVLRPSMHGANAIIAAGSRDSMVYLWRRRAEESEGGAGGRSMRMFTGTTLSGHKV